MTALLAYLRFAGAGVDPFLLPSADIKIPKVRSFTEALGIFFVYSRAGKPALEDLMLSEQARIWRLGAILVVDIESYACLSAQEAGVHHSS